MLAALAVGACGAEAPEGEPLGETSQALETYANEQPAFDYFRLKGLTAEQSAGIVGNLDVESGLDPTIVQKGGPGRGIAQWSAGGRWDSTAGDNVKSYAAAQGKSATSLQLQLDFIWFELTSFPSYGLTKLQATTTVTGAVSAFARDYEVCGACATSQRVAHAQSVLSRFGGMPPGSSSSSGAPDEACTLDATGETGTCITTSACAALGSHVSTPGLCPGASDVQCCTAVADGGSSSSGASGAPAASSGGPLSKPANGSDDENGGCAASGASPRSAPLAGGWALVLGAALLLRRTRRSR
ncbi:MAG: peptidase [Labilithrix sp.]|nr:peptidase [Labilithrix sp.]